MEDKEVLDDKILILAKYLESLDENIKIDVDLITVDDNIYTYEGIEYKILNEREFDDIVQDQIDMMVDDVQYEINHNRLDYNEYINMTVDNTAVNNEIWDSLHDYIGEYTEFENFYIFEE